MNKKRIGAFEFLVVILLQFSLSGFAYCEEQKPHNIDEVANAELGYEIAKFECHKKRVILDTWYAEQYWHHKASLMGETERVYRDHRYQTTAIFILVALVTISGVRISYLQFRKDSISKNLGVGAAKPENQTNFKVSREGIEMSSSVIGLIILLFSFLFFYLYVTNIYELRYVTPVASNAEK